MGKNGKSQKKEVTPPRLLPDVKKSIWGIGALGLALVLFLAQTGNAGPAGEIIFQALSYLLGWGYILLPLGLTVQGIILLGQERTFILGTAALSLGTFILSSLGLIELGFPEKGGLLGLVFGSLKYLFGPQAAFVINLAIFLVSVVALTNIPIKLKWPLFENKREEESLTLTPEEEKRLPLPEEDHGQDIKEEPPKKKEEVEPKITEGSSVPFLKTKQVLKFKDYTPPPLDLLKSSTEKPTTGDLRANANIIKRTLESFGIPVEMGEINIGPKVTRYTLKPAEGIKLSRITALGQDLALALAAHPIRIEAPIPGKSLVGIEIPNRTAALVRLGSLLGYPEAQKGGPLSFALGRDVSGDPIFPNIESMPHLLVAGATGSGKSVTIHSLIVSLLYKNSPRDLKLVMIDPKRVELSVYEAIPHLVGSVITESKKALGVFRWAVGEMDARYGQLLKAGRRDIKSYNANCAPDDKLPYIVIIVDELADMMTSYGREVEGYIIRLAQMARATGIHLILSTQRPSVEVITGLIKANITSRIALQVASQIDSRTILDTAGAEKLLGGGDLLLISSDFSKPRRIQGTYITEDEINQVADFIRENNKAIPVEENVDFSKSGNGGGNGAPGGDVFAEYNNEESDDELYQEAVAMVREAKKASASLLQRRLKVGYARAARLLDLMEMNGLIGPGEGAKPREVFLENINDL